MKTENAIKYRKEYYQKNKEKICAQNKKWREENKEKQAAYLLEWQRKNKKHISEYRKKYAEENPEKVATWKTNLRIRNGLSPEPRTPMNPAEAKIRQREQSYKRWIGNKGKLLEQMRNRYHSDTEFREKRRIYEAEWRKNNKEKIRGYYNESKNQS